MTTTIKIQHLHTPREPLRLLARDNALRALESRKRLVMLFPEAADYYTLICYRNATITGWATVHCGTPKALGAPEADPRVARVDVFVRRKYEGRGLGSLLAKTAKIVGVLVWGDETVWTCHCHPKADGKHAPWCPKAE